MYIALDAFPQVSAGFSPLTCYYHLWGWDIFKIGENVTKKGKRGNQRKLESTKSEIKMQNERK
jgi:hypothetical protein